MTTQSGDLLARWARHQQRIGAPATTMRTYRHYVRAMARELGRPMLAATPDDLMDWIASHTGWSPSARRSARSAARSFYQWAAGEGLIEVSPALLVPAPRGTKGRPRPTPEHIYRRISSSAPDERVRLAARIAGECGLRVGEISRLKVEDLHHEPSGWWIRVQGKGAKERVVPVTDPLAREIRLLGSGPVFPSKLRPDVAVLPGTITRLLSAEMPRGVTPHSLRHRCGTQAYAGTGDLRAVQELLGHESPNTTAVYVGVDNRAIRAAMLAAAS